MNFSWKSLDRSLRSLCWIFLVKNVQSLVFCCYFKTFLEIIAFNFTNEELCCCFLDAVTKRFSIFELTYTLQVFRSIVAKTIWYSVLELSFVNEIIREESALALCSWKRSNIVPDLSKINCVILIDDECFVGKDKMLVDVSCHYDRSVFIFLFCGVEEAISNGTLSLQFPIEVKIILSWLEPWETTIGSGVNNR